MALYFTHLVKTHPPGLSLILKSLVESQAGKICDGLFVSFENVPLTLRKEPLGTLTINESLIHELAFLVVIILALLNWLTNLYVTMSCNRRTIRWTCVAFLAFLQF